MDELECMLEYLGEATKVKSVGFCANPKQMHERYFIRKNKRKSGKTTNYLLLTSSLPTNVRQLHV